MKVYTRGGDGGETALFGGARVRKDALRVEAYGSVDELNALLGVTRAKLGDSDLGGWLGTIQSALFDLGSSLATPEGKAGAPQLAPGGDEIAELESWIDQLDDELEPLKTFILPGGDPAAADLHLARTVCRRAERRVVTLAAEESVDAGVVGYLNRLSDLLFTMARAANARAGVAEAPWVGRER